MTSNDAEQVDTFAVQVNLEQAVSLCYGVQAITARMDEEDFKARGIEAIETAILNELYGASRAIGREIVPIGMVKSTAAETAAND